MSTAGNAHHAGGDARRATWAGAGAIAIWSSLASLTAVSGPMPPFQLTAMSFAIATLVGVAYTIATRVPLSRMVAMPPAVWALGLYGLLGYHAAYFYALKTAPPLEASIINYLWPLLIVAFSCLLPANRGGGRLGWRLAIGALLAAAGTAIAITSGAASSGPNAASPFSGSALGYLAALASAIIWASYSVASRLFAHVPTASLAGLCAATSLGAAILHVATETTHWPLTAHETLIVLACGLGPVGLAFYLWDHGMKHGEIRLLGVLAYATPLLSLMLLAAFGISRLTPLLALAGVLVTAGAVVAAPGRRA